ncbi:MAG: PIN domain-containing protein [Kiritimatiellae bacterium]|nr:PIN domain-containing protein [Kiritimatiellia bacterium]
MTFGFDTSVVLRLLTGRPADLAAKALARYQDGIAAGDDFTVSDLVASETYYAIQHHYGKTKEEALVALKNFSLGDGISFSSNFLSAINTPDIHKAKPGFVDRMLALDYGSKGQITLSCEKSFRRLPDTEIIG